MTARAAAPAIANRQQDVIAGEGPDRQRLEQRARALGLANHVRFVGNLERREELPAWSAPALMHQAERFYERLSHR